MPENRQITLGVLLISLFILAAGLVTFVIVSQAFGFWTGFGAGILMGYCSRYGLCKILDHWESIKRKRRRNETFVEYKRIFQVLALPANEKKGVFKRIMPKNPEIRTGDFGWEIRPPRQNGLIYLQGYDENWRRVWQAGFRRDQIEYIGPKPTSLKPKTPCPYPIQPRSKEIGTDAVCI